VQPLGFLLETIAVFKFEGGCNLSTHEGGFGKLLVKFEIAQIFFVLVELYYGINIFLHLKLLSLFLLILLLLLYFMQPTNPHGVEVIRSIFSSGEIGLEGLQNSSDQQSLFPLLVFFLVTFE
jgi:hypothetical protein